MEYFKNIIKSYLILLNYITNIAIITPNKIFCIKHSKLIY